MSQESSFVTRLSIALTLSLLSGCMIKINRMPTEAPGPLQVTSPARTQRVSYYQEFSGTCDPARPVIAVTYPAEASGAATTPCTGNGTFKVGIRFTTAFSSGSAIRFSQNGSPPIDRPVEFSAGGIPGTPDGFDQDVNAVVHDPVTGHTYYGGLFQTYKGFRARMLVRVRQDGSPDSTFLPPGDGFEGGQVNALALDPARGKLYVGGLFTKFIRGTQTITQNYFACINVADGSLDTSFVTDGGGFDARVMKLAVDTVNGGVYVGGFFLNHTRGGITTGQKYITRIKADGSVDTAFIPAGDGFDNWVQTLVFDPGSSRLYVGGDFTSHTRGGSTTPVLRITRLSTAAGSAGVLDAGFVPAAAGFNSRVYALAVDTSAGKVYAGGQFTSYTNGGTTTQKSLARLNLDGTVDTGFIAAGDGLVSASPYCNDLLWNSATSQLIVGGYFTSFSNRGTTTTQKYLMRLNSDGSVDTGFIPDGGGLNAIVASIQREASTGNILIGGQFTQINRGTSLAQKKVTRLRNDGSVDTAYIRPSGGGFDSSVNAVAFDSRSKWIYAGGSFTSYSSGDGNFKAQLRLTRVGQDGLPDLSFMPDGDGFNGVVNALVLDASTGRIYVGGSFTSLTRAGVTTPQNYLSRLNPDGTVDTSFVPTAGGFDSTVTALYLDDAAGKLYVGGAFATYTNGAATTQNRLTRLNLNGTVDTGFIPAGAGFNSTVYSIDLDPVSKKVYAAGNFTSYTNGAAVTQFKLTRLNPDGTVDTSFVPAGRGMAPINRPWVVRLERSTGKVYVGGNFAGAYQGATIIEQNNLTRFNPDGSVDTGFIPPATGAGFDGLVASLELEPGTGKIYVAGYFTAFTRSGTAMQGRMARLNPDGTVDTTFLRDGGGFAAGTANSIALDPLTGNLIVGGAQTSYMSVVVNTGLTVIQPDGSLAP